MIKKTVKIGEFKAPLRDEFFSAGCLDPENPEAEEKEIRKLIPKNYVWVASESSDEDEDQLWDLIHGAYPKITYVNCFVKGKDHLVPQKVADGIWCTGEMTWVVFIDPILLQNLVLTKMA